MRRGRVSRAGPSLELETYKPFKLKTLSDLFCHPELVARVGFTVAILVGISTSRGSAPRVRETKLTHNKTKYIVLKLDLKLETPNNERTTSHNIMYFVIFMFLKTYHMVVALVIPTVSLFLGIP